MKNKEHSKFNEGLSHTSMVHKVKEKKNKHKRRISCEQNKNRGIPIIVEEERWDANRGIPKLELLPLLILLLSVTPCSSNTLSTQNITKTSIIKQITTFR